MHSDPAIQKLYEQAKLDVWSKIEYFKKDQQMEQGARYRYVGEGKITRHARAAMIACGITTSPAGMRLIHHEAATTKNGGTSNFRIIEATWRFRHIDGGFEDVVVLGEAADSGDKASNKAMTASKKYAILLWLLAYTGDDPDKTSSSQHERAPANQNASQRTQGASYRDTDEYKQKQAAAAAAAGQASQNTANEGKAAPKASPQTMKDFYSALTNVNQSRRDNEKKNLTVTDMQDALRLHELSRPDWELKSFDRLVFLGEERMGKLIQIMDMDPVNFDVEARVPAKEG